MVKVGFLRLGHEVGLPIFGLLCVIGSLSTVSCVDSSKDPDGFHFRLSKHQDEIRALKDVIKQMNDHSKASFKTIQTLVEDMDVLKDTVIQLKRSEEKSTKTISELIADKEKLMESQEKHAKTINELVADNEQLKESQEKSTKTINELIFSNEQLKQFEDETAMVISQLNANHEVSKNEIGKLLAENEILTQRVKDFEMGNGRENATASNNHQKRLLLDDGSIGPKVAFAARLSTHMTNLGHQQLILFDKAITNVGDAYNPTTGVFTAPADGVYFFLASILSHSNDVLEAEIVKNGDTQVLMYAWDTKHEQGTNGVALALAEGDTVWVRHTGTVGDQIYGNNWSSFTGFQIA